MTLRDNIEAICEIELSDSYRKMLPSQQMLTLVAFASLIRKGLQNTASVDNIMTSTETIIPPTRITTPPLTTLPPGLRIQPTDVYERRFPTTRYTKKSTKPTTKVAVVQTSKNKSPETTRVTVVITTSPQIDQEAISPFIGLAGLAVLLPLIVIIVAVCLRRKKREEPKKEEAEEGKEEEEIKSDKEVAIMCHGEYESYETALNIQENKKDGYDNDCYYKATDKELPFYSMNSIYQNGPSVSPARIELDPQTSLSI